MRTKSLLTAGALAMLMAACSNEELELSNSQLNGNRPLAGDVVLTPGLGGEESRAIWENNGWTWGAGDKFGALLMDTWDQLGTGFNHYSFTNYIHTNYPFTTEDGKIWKSVAGAPLCEGNYFFTWPFNPELTSRGGVYFEVDAKQSNVDENGKVDAIIPVKEQQKYLGYAFVEAAEGDVNEVDAKFHYVFANPKFKIENLTGVSLKVLKLLVRAHETPNANPSLLPTKVQLKPEGWANAKNYTDGLLTSKQETAELQNVLEWVKDETQTYEYVIDCGDNYIVENGNNIRVSVVMPGGQYGQLDVYAFVEKQNEDKQCGVIRLNETGNVEWDGQSQAGPMQTTLKPGVTQLYTATLYAQSIGNLGVQGFTVVTSEDLAFVIDLKAKHGGDERVKITTWGDKVELTKEVVDLIKVEDRENIEWYINGTIVIPADAPANAIDLLSTDANFAQTTIINKGKQVLSKSTYYCNIVNEGTITEAENVNVAIIGNVTNAEGAEMTVATISGQVDNKGTITVDKVIGNVNNGLYEAERKNGLAVTTTAEAKLGTIVGQLRNWGKVSVENINGGYSNKQGTMEFLGGTYANGGANHKDGIIIVSGESNINKLDNSGVVSILANTEANIVSIGTINVAGGAQLKGRDFIKNLDGGIINVEGKLQNNIYNSGTIYVKNDGLVDVKGVVTDVTVIEINEHNNNSDQSVMMIIDANTVGTIDVTEASDVYTSHTARTNSQSMYFAYTVGEETTAAELVDALKARISSDNYNRNPIKLTWATTSADKFAGLLDEGNIKFVTINNSLLINGNTRFAEIGTEENFVVNGSLTIANNVYFRIGSTTSADTYYVRIDGTLKANNQSHLLGTVKVKGEGEVLIESTTASQTWSKAGTFTGTWNGK